MNGNQMAGFVPMPMSFLFPQQQQTGQREQIDKPPARVLVAMEFLRRLADKQSINLASEYSGHDGFMEAKGQEVLPVERETEAAACKLLTAYFQGKVKPSSLEKEEAQRLVEGEKKPAHKVNGPWSIYHCFACGGGPNQRRCTICKGSGQMICAPTVATAEETDNAK